MNRVDSVAFLNGCLSQPVSVLGLPTTDASPGWKIPIDQSFRKLGISTTNLPTAVTVSESDDPSLEKLLLYYGLRYLLYQATTKVDLEVIGAGGREIAKRSQLFTQLKDALVMAEKELRQAGFSVSGSLRSGRFAMDYLEPWSAEFAS